MTTAAPAIVFDATSDAHFRSWGSAISGALQTCGLVQTTDTGQINWTTVSLGTHTVSVNALINVGYEIYKFNDSLQSTKPIFIKIEYGAYGFGPTTFWQNPQLAGMTVGTGTNGAGTLTGASTRQTPVANLTGAGSNSRTGTTTTAASQCYFSGDGSYINVALGVDSTTVFSALDSGSSAYELGSPTLIVVDRTRDSTGAITSDGCFFAVSSWQGSSVTHASVPTPNFQLISFTGAGAGTVDTYWPVSWPQAGWGTGTVGSDIYFWPLPLASPVAESQSLAILGCYTSDLAIASTISVSVLGSTHTYLALTGINATAASRSWVDPNVTSGALIMRYE